MTAVKSAHRLWHDILHYLYRPIKIRTKDILSRNDNCRIPFCHACDHLNHVVSPPATHHFRNYAFIDLCMSGHHFCRLGLNWTAISAPADYHQEKFVRRLIIISVYPASGCCDIGDPHPS